MKKLGGGLGVALDVVEKRSTPNSNGIDNFDHRYSNINLNENNKCSNISSLVQSDSKSKKHDKIFGKQAAVRRNHNKVTVKNTENPVFCALNYKHFSFNKIFRFSDIANFTAVPPINAEFDDWFTTLLKENVKIHVKGFMYHTFENCVPLLIPGHLCFILTSDDVLLLVKRVTFDTVKVVVIHDIDENQFYANGSSSDECIWAAAFCGRDADKIKVHMFYQEWKYSAQWTAAVLLSKYSVSDEFGVCEVPDEPDDKAQLQQVFAAVPCNKARYKRKTFDCYCCCRKPHLDKRSTARSERLKHSTLIECGKCKSWQYFLCNGIPKEGVSRAWLCSACRPVPLLPKWGPGDVFVNTLIYLLYIYLNLFF
uniref:Uncharacterized protein n=1 Tax=Panagrolaimus davidi TaxID=227884 RepID=A0A914PR06_9BILA